MKHIERNIFWRSVNSLKIVPLLSLSLLATACGANAVNHSKTELHPPEIITFPVPVPIISQPSLCADIEAAYIPNPKLPSIPKLSIQATGFAVTDTYDVIIRISTSPSVTTGGDSLLHRIVSYNGSNAFYFDSSIITRGDLTLPEKSSACIVTFRGEFADTGPKIKSNPVFSGIYVPSFRKSSLYNSESIIRHTP